LKSWVGTISLISLISLSACVTTGSNKILTTPGIYPIKSKSGKVIATLQTQELKPLDVPPKSDLANPIWWLQTGGTHSTWTAPLVNNGQVYLPGVTNQFERDLLWWLRNPAGNFVGFIVGFEGKTYKVTGTYPVSTTTWRDLNNGRTGWKWSVINGWAPFVSYWAGDNALLPLEFYVGWRPASGGFGTKFVIHHDTTVAPIAAPQVAP
jgi:hypothetical protein